MNATKKKELERFALEVRYHVMDQLTTFGQGHTGGTHSIADLLSVLYKGGALKCDPKNPKWEDRDRLITSKGHAGPAVYATLALMGFFPMDWLKTLNQGGTRLPSHTDGLRTPGIDYSTGSLGQGLSCAVGMAVGAKLKKQDLSVFCIMGDGELQEGQVWEAAMIAPHYKLDNLIAFVDWNKKQVDGHCDDIAGVTEIAPRFIANGWDTVVIDGHDLEAIEDAINAAKANKNGVPKVIILDTIKGKGVPSIEAIDGNHWLEVSKEFGEAAMADLKARLAALD